MQRLTVFIAVLTATLCRASDKAVVVNRGVEVPGVWSATQHLYVKGAILSPARLSELETWLDARGANWTVVLMDQADDETFTDKAGNRYTGMDAVEHSLGRTLPAETGFGELKHPQTAERSGAFFVLFLRERKFAYYGSDAYDHRGLGEENFQQNLDAPAISAMRGGGRIADAVKDTVTFIDGELSRRIAQEAENRRRAIEQAKREREETAAVIASLRGRVTESEAATQELRRQYPAAAGALVTLDTQSWTRRLDAAAEDLAGGRAEEAAAALAPLDREITGRRNALAAHARGTEQLAALLKEIDAVKVDEDSARAQTLLLSSRQTLSQASTAHASADPAWAAKLEEAAGSLRAALTADKDTLREKAEVVRVEARLQEMNVPAAAAAAVAAHRKAGEAVEEARRSLAAGTSAAEALRNASTQLTETARHAAAWQEARAAEKREQQLRRTLLLSATGGAVLLLAGIGYLGNRRRRKVRDEAGTLLTAWEKTFSEKTDGLFKLMDRARTSVGTSAVLEQSGWTGDTRAAAELTIRDVDQLFVMSSAIDGVLDRARALVRPENPWGAAVNFVSRKRYDDAVELLSRESITFAPDDPLRPVLHGDAGTRAASGEWRGLLGKKEEVEPFSMTFDALIAAFNERAARAVGNLERIDGSWLRIAGEREQLNSTLDKVEAAEKRLHDAAVTDGLFLVDPLFDVLLPSARADQTEGDRLAATDPLQALDRPLALAARKAADAQALCALVEETRAKAFAPVQEAATALQKAGRRVVWVDEEWHALSGQTSVLAAKAEEETQKEAITSLTAEIKSFEQRVVTAAALQQRAADESLPEIERVEQAVAGARTEIGAKLTIPAAQILCEDDARNPSVKLATAREQQRSALAELDRGDVAAASQALDACAACCASAVELIEATRAAFAAWPENARQIAVERDRLEQALPHHRAALEELEQNWAASALVSATGDTLCNNADDAQNCLEQCRRALAASEELRGHGHLLTAAESHRQAADLNTHTAALFEETGAHAEKLRHAAAANAQLAGELEKVRDRLAAAAARPEAMQRSVDLMGTVSAAVDRAADAARATGTGADPFQAATALESCRMALQTLEQRLQADTVLYNDARQSVDEAARQLTGLEQLATRSEHDRIPDSHTVTQIVGELSDMMRNLGMLRKRLGEPHETWPEIDQEADELAASAARRRGELGNELDQAAEAVSQLQRASGALRSLHGWSGRMAVLVDTGAGQREFEAARRALDSGLYAEAAALAGRAGTRAQQALDDAEEEERRRRREAERQEEARRRMAAAARMASAIFSGGGSSFGHSSGGGGRSGGGFSSGSRSSSSGTSRSGFSSGSGTSRSGW